MTKIFKKSVLLIINSVVKSILRILALLSIPEIKAIDPKFYPASSFFNEIVSISKLVDEVISLFIGILTLS